ncbi:MAG: hypothetical protein UHK60_10400 [Acutalibacteraceae bacterium]|nr:hypothetical protein [Acutalibacteraceae bacterium]
MKTLEELYYGNILPNKSCAKLNDEVKELLKLLNRNEDEFLKILVLNCNNKLNTF